MKNLIKNIRHSEVIELKNQVEYLSGQIVSKTLSQNKYNSLTLFAFDQGEEISSHESSGDAMISVMDGSCTVTIDGADYKLSEGESIVMPAKVPHAVFAATQFKMLLTVIFPE